MKITRDNVEDAIGQVETLSSTADSFVSAGERWTESFPEDGGDREEHADARIELEDALTALESDVLGLMDILKLEADQERPKMDTSSAVGRIWQVVGPLRGEQVEAVRVVREICANELGIKLDEDVKL